MFGGGLPDRSDRPRINMVLNGSGRMDRHDLYIIMARWSANDPREHVDCFGTDNQNDLAVWMAVLQVAGGPRSDPPRPV